MCCEICTCVGEVIGIAGCAAVGNELSTLIELVNVGLAVITGLWGLGGVTLGGVWDSPLSAPAE